jgi:hypothetical protein
MLRGRKRKIVAASAAVGIVVIAAFVVIWVSSINRIKGLDGGLQAGSGQIVRSQGPTAEFVAALLNQSGKPVTIESASQYGIAGAPMPRIRSFHITGGARPFRGARLRDYVLPTGAEAEINYSVRAPRPGNYASAGLKLVVRQRSTVETISSVGGVQVLCAVPHPGRGCEHLVTKMADIVDAG